MTASIDNFLIQSRNIGTVAELFLAYQGLLQDFGYDRVCYAVTSNHPALNDGHKLGVIYDNNMSDWVEHYAASQYMDIDPVHKQGITNPGVQVWSDWAEQETLLESQSNMFAATERFGLNDGLTVSVHGAGGTKTAILMASSMPLKEKPDIHILDSIHLSSYQFHNIYLDLMKNEFDLHQVALSSKEEDVLQWMAQGCTKTEVGDKLSMSRHTVDYHVRNILKKLDAKNTTAATAIAIQQNYIAL